MRTPLHEVILERWGADIAAGRQPAGSTIAADQAAADFGVSRTAVREAVRVLESLGMVQVRQRVGITVQSEEHWSPYSLRVLRWRLDGPDRIPHLRELGELRQAVEPMAARLAALRATPAQCAELTAAVMGLSATARMANSESYLGHDIRFHTTLLQASGNPMLSSLGSIVVAVLEGRTEHELMPAVANPEAVRLHGDVAAAVQAGDADAAESSMRLILAETAHAIDDASETGAEGDEKR
jgi:DNA-binding FadR family transcriptional regulator